jgi:hypothetical protein
MTPAIELLSPEYRELIETANLDWLVATYIHSMDHLTDHSAFEIKAAAIHEFATAAYGAEFETAVANYR